jgi:hypothetical protein
MKNIEIGQTGKLGNEVLTVVSINGSTFKCDNGKMYMIANAKWMTDGIETAIPKAKKAKKYNAAPENYLTPLSKEESRRIEEYMENARYRQAGSSLR